MLAVIISLAREKTTHLLEPCCGARFDAWTHVMPKYAVFLFFQIVIIFQRLFFIDIVRFYQNYSNNKFVALFFMDDA
jgi:hypothetical protein